MPLFRSLLIVAVLLSACKSNLPLGYDYTPALLHLDKSKQHDSLGFNMATAIPQLVYGKVLSDDLALWSSPAKKIQISSTEFTDLEKTARLPFVESQDLFMHQVWRLYKRHFSFGIIGFSFTGETRDGRKINYGYIDAADIFALLRDRSIPSNANGTSELSYLQAINTMAYTFNLVQFGTENFKQNPLLSYELKNQALEGKRVKREFYVPQEVKELQYKIVHPSISSNSANAAFYQTMQQYVNDNKQTILNTEGAESLAPYIYKPWSIDNVTVTERWSKQLNLPFQELLSIGFFIEGINVTLNKDQLDEMGVKINLQGPEEYLSGKDFHFVLQRINNQEIAAHESEMYFAALMAKPWNKIK